MNIPIVFEDDWLLVVDKPPGLLCVPAPRNQQRTLTGILNQEAEKNKLKHRFYPCHRLDRDTSGLVVYAKSSQIERKMFDAFRNRQVIKKYIAFVHGRLPYKQGQINRPLEGKKALTKYQVLQERGDYSVVEIVPVTGRTNQIRIHFKFIHHPLVGEDKFAFRKDFALRFRRVCLHAKYLEFNHPGSGKKLIIESPLARDLQRFIQEH